MADAVDYDVLIVGAGPVGLTLALDLSRRGVRSLLIEKNLEPLRLPKMERSNPRTMEIWRRLGVMEEIRAAGLPADMPMDVLVVRDLAQPPLVRQQYPSVAETRRRIELANDGSHAREPYQLVSQFVVEPILMERVKASQHVEVRQGVEFVTLTQDDEGVTAEVINQDGSIQKIRSRYLVGTDGGTSRVREDLGVELAGKAMLGTIYNIFFRCDDFLEKASVGFARHYCLAGQSAGGGAAGSIVFQGDLKHLAMHIMTEPPEDPAALIRDVTGLDIDPEVFFCSPWNQHMLVAEQHSVGRVFLAGDANHLYIPAGGLGMNTGIGDATNLAWKLAATLQGWGGAGLLDSYHPERNAAAIRNRAAAQWAVEGVVEWRSSFDPLVDEPTPEGRAAREAFARRAEAGNRRVYEMHGADLGYRYVSDVIDGSEGPAPECPISTYVPTTHPGAHLPHAWLHRGDAIYDRLDVKSYTLLVLNEGHDVSGLTAAFDALGAPLQVITVNDASLRKLYERDLLLIRPDLHVVWRGDVAPASPEALARQVTGNRLS